MTLTSGTQFGVYQIAAALGAGGMGEVYRARDPKLGRDVALKILPEAFANDPERLTRFEREARALAALNHPHIAQIYGFEQHGAAAALVMEFVDGEDLAARIARGPLSVHETQRIAREIAEALDAAHEKGIVHRDLKPANVRLTRDGVVKVLDFGIAKAAIDLESGPATSVLSTVAQTRDGTVLGTAPYMSPEQARGLSVDKRTDVWAFGCLIYEMLTARSPFAAATMSDTIAHVLAKEPDWTALPPAAPPGVIRLVKRCLEKDLKRRLRDLGDLDLALEGTAADSLAPARRGVPVALVLGIVAATAVLTVLGTLGVTRLREPPPVQASSVRFEIPATGMLSSGSPSVSPDGSRMVFSAVGQDAVLRLWVRTFDSPDARPLAGSEGEVAFNTAAVFWSPDHRQIGFYADGKIKTMDSSGGTARVICDVPGVSVGGAWGREDVIVLGNTTGGLLKCPAGGGAASPVTTSGGDANVLHLGPAMLPDRRHLLYLRVSRSQPATNGLYVADLELPPEQQSGERLLETGFTASYVPASGSTGHILFARDRAVWAVPFDHDRLTVTGTPVQLAAPVGSFRDGASFSASGNVLIHRGDAPDLQLQWRDRKGTLLGPVGEPGAYIGLALSPHTTRVAVVRENRTNRADQDVWLVDLARDAMTRLTSDPLLESVPAWSSDGTTLFLSLGHSDGGVVAQPATGAAAVDLLPKGSQQAIRVNPLLTTMSASADGRFLVFTASARARTQSDIWVVSLRQPSHVGALVQKEFDQVQGAISPDGHWLAYVSNESGANQVFIAPLTISASTGLPELSGTALLVSRGGGGAAPRWRADGRELFYQSPSGAVMAATVSGQDVARPIELFQAPGMLAHWGVASDGQRFLVALPVKPNAQVPIEVVLNWRSRLSAK